MRIPLISDLSVAEIATNRAYLTALEHGPMTGSLTGPQLRRVTVLGGAATGLGVALSLARAGISVLFLEEDDSSLERAQFYLKRLVGAGPVANLTLSTQPAGAVGCDLVIDRTIDPIPHKATLLRHMPARTPMLTNLAGPSLTQLAALLPDPQYLLGAEFFAPVAQSRIVELALPAGTDPQAHQTAQALVAQIGKTSVMATPAGFTSEQMMMGLLHAADSLLMDGSTPWEIDEAMEQFGYAMGVYESQDLIGTDVAYAIRQRQPRDPARRYIPIADRAVQEGRLGKKASVGWYRYPGGEGKVIDPLVEDLCREEAHFARHPTHPIPAEDLRLRLLLAQINDTTALLDQGIPARDLNLLSVHALGFPTAWGGILTFANRLGAAPIVAALTRLQPQDPAQWTPTQPLLTAARTRAPIQDAPA